MLPFQQHQVQVCAGPQKAPIGQPYTKVPPYILWLVKHFFNLVVHFLAVFFTFAELVYNLVISDIYQHLS